MYNSHSESAPPEGGEGEGRREGRRGKKESKFCGKLSLEGVAWAIELPFISAKGYFCNLYLLRVRIEYRVKQRGL